MPYTTVHNLLSVFGETASEGETDGWSFGMRFAQGAQTGGEATDAQVTTILDDIQADLGTWWAAINTRVATTTRLLGFKFNTIDVNGRYNNLTKTHQRDLIGSTWTGGATGIALPSQVAIVATLHTAAQRGLANKGRIYLPPLSASTLSAGGRLMDSARDEIAIATGTLLTNLSNWPGVDATADPGRVCVMSKVREGATRQVTGVSVGDRFDIQRRRANAFTENRSAIAPVTS